MWKTFRKNCKLKGKKYALRKVIHNISGLQEYQEQIDTMFYFLNKCVDITKLPQAEGNLRLMQQADAELLHIFHEICEKNNLTYWLDWGTLLGAVRHQGFIPWDDDLDVTMPRADYERAVPLLKEEFSKMGIDAIENERMARIGIGYKTGQTGVWLDVFPIDYTYMKELNEEAEFKLFERMTEYRKFYLKNKQRLSRSQMTEKKHQMIDIADEKNGIKIWYHDPEFEVDLCTYEQTDIFPLQKIMFEGNEYYAPAMIDKYLRKYYGNYMEFPHNGVEHHGSGQEKLTDKAINHGVDMKSVIEELEQYSKRI